MCKTPYDWEAIYQDWYVWPLRIPQFGHEKCPPRWGILLASKKPFIPVNMLAASRGSSASLQTT